MLQTYQKSKSKWNVSETQHCKEPYNTQVCVDFICSRQPSNESGIAGADEECFHSYTPSRKQYMVETEEIQRGWCAIVIFWTWNSWKQCFLIKIHTYGTFHLLPTHLIYLRFTKREEVPTLFHTEIYPALCCPGFLYLRTSVK